MKIRYFITVMAVTGLVVSGYPTVVLTWADGTPYAETGYLEGGPDAYLAHLNELREKR